ncbi:MAG TPA: hypothetical protein VGC80_03235, partial [Acetobacteraceae bacterium]
MHVLTHFLPRALLALAFLLPSSLAGACGVSARRVDPNIRLASLEPEAELSITFLGHASFLIE